MCTINRIHSAIHMLKRIPPSKKQAKEANKKKKKKEKKQKKQQKRNFLSHFCFFVSLPFLSGYLTNPMTSFCFGSLTILSVLMAPYSMNMSLSVSM